MKITRRQLLKAGFVAGGIALVGSGSYAYLDNETITPAPVKYGEVLCDLHAHPANYNSLEETIEMLGSPGLVGLAHVNSTKRNLIYEEATKLLDGHKDFKEITKGRLAKFGKGFFAKTQELSGGIHDLLAVGWEGDYFPDYKDPRKAVEEIKKKNGIAVLCHPYVVSGGLMFRLVNKKEEAKIKELYEMVDEVEAHNAHNINLIPVVSWMKKANVLAAELVKDYDDLSGIASSDAHRRNEQVKLCGIYILEGFFEEGIEGLKRAIKSGSFVRYGDAETGPYVSRASWLKGMIYEQKFGGK